MSVHKGDSDEAAGTLTQNSRFFLVPTMDLSGGVPHDGIEGEGTPLHNACFCTMSL